MPQEIDTEDETTGCGFQGVYLLLSRNSVSHGGTYIGYTINPNRRIKQHNKGKQYGGAKKTSDRGPWDMVLIVHGFPTSAAALGAGRPPPAHMTICHGPVTTSKNDSGPEILEQVDGNDFENCFTCGELSKRGEVVKCLNSPNCQTFYHLRCLALHFLRKEPEMIMPTIGNCPACGSSIVWGNVVTKFKELSRKIRLVKR